MTAHIPGLVKALPENMASLNKCQRLPNWQIKIENPEKLATRRRKTKQKHHTTCVEHHYMQTNTNNVNKT